MIYHSKKGGAMPNRDRTGPEGKGPRTGRGKGPCKQETTRKNRRSKKSK